MSKQRETVFFIDRAIGQKAVPEALIAAGETVEAHTAHFAPDALDEDWLPTVSEWGWVVLTKDKNIGRKPREVKAIARSNGRVFVLVSGKLTSQQMADLFVNVLGKLKKFTQDNQAPFIAKIYKDGRVELWKNQTQLLKLLEDEEKSP